MRDFSREAPGRGGEAGFDFRAKVGDGGCTEWYRPLHLSITRFTEKSEGAECLVVELAFNPAPLLIETNDAFLR